MTFANQVNALTGLTINSGNAPSNTELTQFLHDGVYDVTSRCVALKPEDSYLFQTVTSSDTTANNSLAIKGRILRIMRETGTDGDYRKCTQISPALESRVTDADSIHFASKYNPVYMLADNGKISVFPAPGSSNDGFKVYYINNDPKRDSDAATLAYDSEDIRNFPKDKYYLVSIYASIQSLLHYLSSMKDPSVGGVDEELTSAITAGAIANASDQLDVSDWWDVAADLIETEEDPELGQVQIQKIAAYIQAWQQQLQGNMAEYQWMQSRMEILKVQYDAAFALMGGQQKAPKQQQKGRR
tara:strand:+ start:557 stop:1456 length:900 start_codon:yes stop_codon:yes gene_type:complete